MLLLNQRLSQLIEKKLAGLRDADALEGRLSKGQPPVDKPGPKKVKSLDLGKLRQKIRDLYHSVRRSRGTAQLHEAFKDAISRRELDEIIESVRNESNRQRATETFHITWMRPNLS